MMVMHTGTGVVKSVDITSWAMMGMVSDSSSTFVVKRIAPPIAEKLNKKLLLTIK